MARAFSAMLSWRQPYAAALSSAISEAGDAMMTLCVEAGIEELGIGLERRAGRRPRPG